MLRIKYKGLSRKGAGKLRSLKVQIPQTAMRSLRHNFETTRRFIANKAPSKEQEAALLSRGLASGRLVGTPEGGRFKKRGNQRWVKDALLVERPIVTMNNNYVILKWGNIARINSKIGFSWETVKGQTRKTSTKQVLWGNLIQLWEGASVMQGSYSARITSRGKYPLRPEDNVAVPYVDKTIPSFGMVQKGYAGTRVFYKKKVADDIRAKAQQIGQA